MRKVDVESGDLIVLQMSSVEIHPTYEFVLIINVTPIDDQWYIECLTLGGYRQTTWHNRWIQVDDDQQIIRHGVIL